MYERQRGRGLRRVVSGKSRLAVKTKQTNTPSPNSATFSGKKPPVSGFDTSFYIAFTYNKQREKETENPFHCMERN